MEDTLREERRYSYTGAAEVLILVLMEDTLRANFDTAVSKGCYKS